MKNGFQDVWRKISTGRGEVTLRRPVQKVTAVLFGAIALVVTLAPRLTGLAFVPHDPKQITLLAEATTQAFGIQGLITGTLCIASSLTRVGGFSALLD